jgi:hypothetical protein
MAATDDDIINAVQVYRLAKESVDSLLTQKQALIDQRTGINAQIDSLTASILLARQVLQDNRVTVKSLITSP